MKSTYNQLYILFLDGDFSQLFFSENKQNESSSPRQIKVDFSWILRIKRI